MDLSTLLSKFKSERNIAAKEVTLNEVIQQYPGVGAQLLELASTTQDPDTRWLAIRGLGELKYKQSSPYLIQCLSDKNDYVRANSARALGEIRDQSAVSALIKLLEREQNGGVVEQTSLALQMLEAKGAIPTLKKRINHPSAQTRGWIVGAISALGSRDDVPFFANCLNDKDSFVGGVAAGAIEKFTGQDFNLPKGGGPQPIPTEGIKKAKSWWEANRRTWRP